ncbi:ATP synthase F(0) complex subunit B1, mitochondrial [Cichlidogyrus casuarinus]|uniref:ATP synthase subunit b n=1 Tax=Cichlidogyrus casuarinus TaxID=1844966 RepID=A0ABD2Q4G2_9PLAT
MSASSKNVQLVQKAIKDAEESAKVYSQHVDKAVATWDKSNEIYYGKERDLKNFPPIRVAEYHPTVRFGVIPDTWFQAMYEKTGVTGPYMFGIGALTYLMSKEILVYGAHLFEYGPFIICVTYMIKKFGPQIAAYTDDWVQKTENERYYKPLQTVKSNIDRTIQTAQEEITRAEAIPMLAKAKQENLALELEQAYRSRIMHVYKTVQRRLDYHVAKEATRKSFQQQHMVNWIVDSVKKGITPQQEKETIANCIAELKRLSQTAKA